MENRRNKGNPTNEKRKWKDYGNRWTLKTNSINHTATQRKRVSIFTFILLIKKKNRSQPFLHFKIYHKMLINQTNIFSKICLGISYQFYERWTIISSFKTLAKHFILYSVNTLKKIDHLFIFNDLSKIIKQVDHSIPHHDMLLLDKYLVKSEFPLSKSILCLHVPEMQLEWKQQSNNHQME
jgi:hypothetical protein